MCPLFFVKLVAFVYRLNINVSVSESLIEISPIDADAGSQGTFLPQETIKRIKQIPTIDLRQLDMV